VPALLPKGDEELEAEGVDRPEDTEPENGLMTMVGFTVVIELSDGPSVTTSQVVGPEFGYEHL